MIGLTKCSWLCAGQVQLVVCRNWRECGQRVLLLGAAAAWAAVACVTCLPGAVPPLPPT